MKSFSDIDEIFEDEYDPIRIAEAFQEALFWKADDEEDKACEHDDIEKWADGRGFCRSCGVMFTDTTNTNSTIANCLHENSYRNDSGVVICTQCGCKLEDLDSTQEWHFYGVSDSRGADPARCHQNKAESKGIRPVLEAHQVEVSPALCALVQCKYDKVLASSDNKMQRGCGRNAIVANCLFFAYQEIGEYRTSSYVRKKFDVKHKRMTQGMTAYFKAFPEHSVAHITPESLLPWIMRLTGVSRDHYRRILMITRYLAETSTLIERSTPQSVAAASIYFYLCINPTYKAELGLSKSAFAQKAQLSDITVTKIVREIASISRQAITM